MWSVYCWACINSCWRNWYWNTPNSNITVSLACLGAGIFGAVCGIACFRADPDPLNHNDAEANVDHRVRNNNTFDLSNIDNVEFANVDYSAQSNIAQINTDQSMISRIHSARLSSDRAFNNNHYQL